MTGISDVVRSARSYSRLILTQMWIRQVPSHLPGFPNAFMVEDVPNLDSMFTRKLTYFQEASDAYMEGSEARSIATSSTHAASSITSPYKWGLILPVCCRSSDGAETCFGMLEDFVASVERTTSVQDRKLIAVYMGIDDHDIFYDNNQTRKRITALFHKSGIIDINFSKLRSHYRGKLCRIWDLLGGKSRAGWVLFSMLMLDDDVRPRSPGWKGEVEDEFENLAASTSFSLGAAFVAFRVMSLSVFPTFPVIRRGHFEIFSITSPQMNKLKLAKLETQASCTTRRHEELLQISLFLSGWFQRIKLHPPWCAPHSEKMKPQKHPRKCIINCASIGSSE